MKNVFTSASWSLKISAWAIGLFVFIAACFFYPSDARPDVFYFADAFFSLTIAMMILSFDRFFNKSPNEDDAANLATLGPTLFLVLILLGISYTSLNKSIHGADETALILNVAYVGLLIAGFAFFTFIKTNVEVMRKQHAKPSNHLKWKNELSTLSVLSTHSESKKLFKKLADALKYFPSDTHEAIAGEAKIEDAITQLNRQLDENTEVNVVKDILDLEARLNVYQSRLKNSRHKA